MKIRFGAGFKGEFAGSRRAGGIFWSIRRVCVCKCGSGVPARDVEKCMALPGEAWRNKFNHLSMRRGRSIYPRGQRALCRLEPAKWDFERKRRCYDNLHCPSKMRLCPRISSALLLSSRARRNMRLQISRRQTPPSNFRIQKMPRSSHA